jgi:hypothetical protein
MNPKLSVLVQIDLDGQQVTLDVTGTLTETNQQVLPPLIHRARTTFPEAGLSVNLHRARLGDPAAIDALAGNLQDDSPGTVPVQITAPAHPVPHHPQQPPSAATAGIWAAAARRDRSAPSTGQYPWQPPFHSVQSGGEPVGL